MLNSRINIQNLNLSQAHERIVTEYLYKSVRIITGNRVELMPECTIDKLVGESRPGNDQSDGKLGCEQKLEVYKSIINVVYYINNPETEQDVEACICKWLGEVVNDRNVIDIGRQRPKTLADLRMRCLIELSVKSKDIREIILNPSSNMSIQRQPQAESAPADDRTYDYYAIYMEYNSNNAIKIVEKIANKWRQCEK